tara:strand:- start:1507 stop:2211 length:705 start_codon:yes stop_codon:yes gene_type:complete
MGQNSTEVSYGFGQMGSVYMNISEKPVFPPKDHVICAIQFVAANSLLKLHTETLDGQGPQYITTEDDELKSAGGPDANYLGVTEAAASGGTAAGVITIADVIANKDIKPGQVIAVVSDASTIDLGITVDTGAGHIMPIYNGPNKAYLEVVSLTGGTYGTTLTVKAVGKADAALAALANIDGDNTILFLDPYHGVGGTTIEGTSFPTGIVIYGRWTEVQLGSSDADGGIICYFGK